MAIADKMIYLRSHSGLSTEELSAQSGVPVGTINKLFTGETKNPTGKTASKIAKVFGVTAEYLLNDDIPIEGIKKEPTPVTGDGLSDPITAQIMDIVCQMSQEERRLYLENLKTLRLLQEQGRKPDILG